ncbi:GrpB family protein [Streptococcus mitis]|uniref:Dephospho-CoA kinase/protein folding accessory domain-containing protein n=1 Tax=Streptococcus mitis TaxID=28037 RepID=A0A428CMF5_STRMT|nr:GrpB family protein [Streptococcus mitis]RSI79297.1 dephospho-CoA kinase/protein folding accessory domain-containing protein [Streptococcus mitis]
MIKKLEEMSLEELWQLFPIFLVEHKSEWKDWYELEKANLIKILGANVIKRIEHIGSTAIPNIWAKNIVDILLEVGRIEDLARVRDLLVKNGWLVMSESPNRISLNKGYTEQGFAEKVFHLHLRLIGDHDEIYFRDYLCQHPDITQAYQELKLSLWKKFEHNRDAYTTAKTDFIKYYVSEAKSRNFQESEKFHQKSLDRRKN